MMEKLFSSLLDLPRQFERFWSADIGIKIQVLIFLSILYAFGYITARLLRAGAWWKWLLLLILFPSLVLPFIQSYDFVFIGPIIIGFFVGFLRGGDFELFGWFYRMFDWFSARRYRRAEIKNNDAFMKTEEKLRSSQEQEEQTKQRTRERETEHLYEDILRREADLDERERKFKEEMRTEARTNGTRNDNGSSSQSRDKNSNGWQRASQERSNSAHSKTSYGIMNRYLRTMGLDPHKKYSKSELKRAYRKRVKETHPDMGGSVSSFQELTSHYEWLVSKTIQKGE